MFITFTGEKNDDLNHPDYVPNQFSFVKPPMKAKVKHDLIRYHLSEEIKAKQLMSATSNTVSVVEVVDTEDSSADVVLRTRPSLRVWSNDRCGFVL